MILSRPLFCCLMLLAPAWAGKWLGISKSRPAPAATAPALRAPAPAADTTRLSHLITSVPADYAGAYLGTLEGVRCFNCAPDQVQLNLGDSVSSQAAVLALHIDIWNSIERPLRDRRMYDYENRCFYFGHKAVDTAFVGGEWSEIRVQALPCFPYVKRTLNASPSVMTVGAPPLTETPGHPAPAPSPAASPADVVLEPADD